MTKVLLFAALAAVGLAALGWTVYFIGIDGYMEFRLNEAELKRMIRDIFLVEMKEVGSL